MASRNTPVSHCTDSCTKVRSQKSYHGINTRNSSWHHYVDNVRMATHIPPLPGTWRQTRLVTGALTGDHGFNLQGIRARRGVQIQVVSSVALDLTWCPSLMPHFTIHNGVCKKLSATVLKSCFHTPTLPFPQKGRPSCPVLQSFGRWPSLCHSRSVCHPIWQHARSAQACWRRNRPTFLGCTAALNLGKPSFLVVKESWDCLNVLAQRTSYEVTIQILNWLPASGAPKPP